MVTTEPWINMDPRELIPTLTPLAEMSGIKLTRRPTDKQLQKMMNVWGSAKVFEKNAPNVAKALKLGGIIPDEQILQLIRGTGLLKSFGLRTIKGPSRPLGPVVVLLAAGIANWTQKRVEEFLKHATEDHNIQVAMVILLAGDRVCEQPTELTNEYVRRYMSTHSGRPPKEFELLPYIIKQKLGTRREVHHISRDREVQVRKHLKERPSIANFPVYYAGNAPVTIGEALHIRRVIREEFPSFDANGDQFWMSQGVVGLAVTERQARNSFVNQRPLSFFSSLARDTKELYLLHR